MTFWEKELEFKICYTCNSLAAKCNASHKHTVEGTGIKLQWEEIYRMT